jgi:hypothetical protein
MIKRAIFRKSFRIVSVATVVGASAALLLIGAPADAASADSSTYAAAFYSFSRGI